MGESDVDTSGGDKLNPAVGCGAKGRETTAGGGRVDLQLHPENWAVQDGFGAVQLVEVRA